MMSAANSRRVAVVTGGSRGIGQSIALKLAADGLAVVVNYHSDDAAAQQVVAAIRHSGGAAVAVRADVTQPAEVPRLFDAAQQEFGGLDVWVNNAGVFHAAALTATTDADFWQIFSVNTFAVFLALREAGERIRDGGRVVLISSGMTALGRPGSGLFSASKAAAEQLARVLADELGARGVTVNSVLSGPIRTGSSVLPQNVVAQLVADTPLGRRGEPQDVADVVSFLASPAAGWVTGQRLHVSGGLI